MDLRRVCVFCGSSTGKRPIHAAAARELGREMVARGLELVYGGGSVGLMGVLADAVLAAGGRVTGVLPHALQVREVGHRGLTVLEVVPTMHARKARMAELSDAFVALPGGIGTLEELLEITTWAQLGIHRKPIGLLDLEGYFAGLRAQFARAADEGFMRPEHFDFFVTRETPAELLDALASHRPPPVTRWVMPGEG